MKIYNLLIISFLRKIKHIIIIPTSQDQQHLPLFNNSITGHPHLSTPSQSSIHIFYFINNKNNLPFQANQLISRQKSFSHIYASSKSIFVFWTLIIFLFLEFQLVLIYFKGMFQENNEAFLMSFTENMHVDSAENSCPSVPTHQTMYPTIHVLQPKELIDDKHDGYSKKSSSGKEKNPRQTSIRQTLQKLQGDSPTRINHLRVGSAISRKRKFSSSGQNIQIDRLSDLKGETSKSEKSYDSKKERRNEDNCDEQHQGQDHENINDKSQEQLDAMMIFMKKIRTLESRIKNLCLKYETEQFKLRQENQKNRKSLEIYEEHIQSKYPEIFEAIDRKIKEAEENRNCLNCFSDSSSQNIEAKDQTTMPVYSQLEQVRLQGKKFCQRLKSMQITVKQLQKQIFTTRRASQDNGTLGNTSKMFRKWSIPYNYGRLKKRSFQTTINSVQQKKQRFSKNSSNPALENQQARFKRFSMMGIDTPVIKEDQVPEPVNASPVKFVSERFIHVENYEMDFEETGEKKINSWVCQNCTQLRNFLLKMNHRLKKLPVRRCHGSLQNLF